jgi:hypothetical protein
MESESAGSWKYYWVKANVAPGWVGMLETPEGTYYMFVRTQWEPKADGLSKPHNELLAFIYFDIDTQRFRIYYDDDPDVYPLHAADSLAAAQCSAESHTFQKTKDFAVYGS